MIKLTKKEISTIRLALYLAIQWEETVIEAQANCDWLDESTKESEQHIARFEQLSKKLKK